MKIELKVVGVLVLLLCVIGVFDQHASEINPQDNFSSFEVNTNHAITNQTFDFVPLSDGIASGSRNNNTTQENEEDPFAGKADALGLVTPVQGGEFYAFSFLLILYFLISVNRKKNKTN